MTTFVIEYHAVSGDYRVTDFSGREGRRAAMELRMALERQHHRNDGWEIVSLHADSLDTLKATHSRYFEGREMSVVA